MSSKNIADIDRNLSVQSILPEGVRLHSVLEPQFGIYGLFEPERGVFERMPKYMQEDESINDGARRLMRHTSGGRVRFRTDSRNIAIRVDLGMRTVFSHMAATGVCGFDMYACRDGFNRYVKTFVPPQDTSVTEYEGVHTFEEARERIITIHMPLYNEVKELYIGLDEGASLLPAPEYTHQNPIVFYGSSVTQGACASRPGMSHTNILTRMLDCDTVNFGFSGSDRGETALAEYMAKLPMSVFVHGYGYNAPSLEHYANTYYPFYRIIREHNPTLPIIMVSNPVCCDIKDPSRTDYLTRRRAITIRAYTDALESGDKNVYFRDGFDALGELDAADATADGTHPTDLGFMNMARQLYPLLKKLLSE